MTSSVWELHKGGGGPGFVRDTVIVPENSVITGLIFSIRNEILTEDELASGEIFISNDCGFTSVATGIRATVMGPSSSTDPNCCAFVSANFPVNQCDLLSVRFNTNRGAFNNGAAAVILFSSP